MAYQTGAATDVSDLLDRLRIFAVANGWTMHRWSANWLVLEVGGHYVNLFADTGGGASDDPGPFIRVRGSVSYSGGLTFSTQTGGSPETHVNNIPAGIYAYHFFGNSTYMHVVVVPSSGIHKHFGFGAIDKHGTYTGGGYIHGGRWFYSGSYASYPENSANVMPWDNSLITTTNHSALIRADIDSATNKWFSANNIYTTGSRARAGFRAESSGGRARKLILNSPNTLNQLSPLIPIDVFVERPSSVYSYAGQIIDMRYVNITNLEPGSIMTIAGDEWMVFPVIQKGAGNISGSLTPYSGNYGYAYKRVV